MNTNFVDLPTAHKRAQALDTSACGARHHWAWKKDHPSVNYDKQCSDARLANSVLCAHDNGKPNLVKALATAVHHELMTQDQQDSIVKLMNEKFQDLAFVDLLPMGVLYELVGSDMEFDSKTMEAYAKHGLDKQPKDLGFKDIERITVREQKLKGKLFIEIKDLLVDIFAAGKQGNKEAARDISASFLEKWTKSKAVVANDSSWNSSEEPSVKHKQSGLA